MAFIVKTEIAQPRSLIIKRNAIFKIFPNLWSNTSGNFWNLINNPYDKTITNFNINYIGGQVDINWGEGINPNIPSNTNINHTFGTTTEGISIFSINGADVKNISCGTSSPQLSGTITISSFPNLTGFTCRKNGITAFSGIQSCGNLRKLDLGFNSLKTFPSFNSTPLLEELRLEENLLTGSIPSLSNLTNLKIFRVQENKNVTGNLPSLSLLPNLKSFYAIRCNLRGPIPDLSQNTLLEDLRIDSQTTSPKINGSIPSLSANTNLSFFYCHNNQITGTIPSFSANPLLRDFRCYDNKLSGAIPSLTPNANYLQDFRCGENQLTGSIPSLVNMYELINFYCNDNKLIGVIPNFSNNYYLQNFDCSNNQLTGSIPTSIDTLYNLNIFNCSNNQLSGSIPSLNATSQLEDFYCNNNRLTGFGGGSVSNTLGNFQAQNNFLTSGVVNSILSSFVSASRATGTRILNLGGAGNAAPVGQGITDKAFLISPLGWTVTTN